MKSKVIIIILATLVLSISCAKEEPQQKPDQLEKFTEYEWDWK